MTPYIDGLDLLMVAAASATIIWNYVRERAS